MRHTYGCTYESISREKTHSEFGQHHPMGWILDWIKGKTEKANCTPEFPFLCFLVCPDVSKQLILLLPQPQAVPMAMFSHRGGLYTPTGLWTQVLSLLQQAYPLGPFLSTCKTASHVQRFRLSTPFPLHKDPLRQKEVRPLSKGTRYPVELRFDLGSLVTFDCLCWLWKCLWTLRAKTLMNHRQWHKIHSAGRGISCQQKAHDVRLIFSFQTEERACSCERLWDLKKVVTHWKKTKERDRVKLAWDGGAGAPGSCSKSQGLCSEQLYWGLLGLVLEGAGTEGSTSSPALSPSV